MRACAVAVVAALAACTNPNLGRAKQARYDVDPTLVFQGALDATQEQYVELDAFPDRRLIKTAWHQVHNGDDSSEKQQVRVQGRGQPMQRTSFKRRFIRFDVQVTGERPYLVEMRGYASEWAPGSAVPTMLDGAARPGWLDQRTDSLRAAIYERLQKHAVIAPGPVAATH